MKQSPTPPGPACCCGGSQVAAERTAVTSEPRAARFDLVDHFGQSVSERSYGDKYLLVFFGFTNCRVVCPRELSKLSSALAKLGELADRVQALYVTVDPARDDPATMQRYVAQYTGGFIGLTGSSNRVAAAKKAFRVFAEPAVDAAAPGGYVVPHTAFAWLVSPQGRCIAHYPDSLDADTVAERLRLHLA